MFTALFGSAPTCAGCTFERDWRRFIAEAKKPGGMKKIINLQEQRPMGQKEENMEYRLHNRHRAEILTYVKGGKPFRTYGRTMTDEFAREYLTNGSPEQLEQRRRMFAQVPKNQEKNAPAKVVRGIKDLSAMKRAELDKLAKLRGWNPGDFPNKSALIKALRE